VLPLEYYRRAVGLLASELSSARLLIVSDDPSWCRQHLDLGYPSTVVERVPGTDHEDMRLMSMCSHHIIANSSFGWWGAWLAGDRSRRVIAPRRWFADEAVDTRDLIPQGWVLL
jgi:Glycosyl transferase family 11